MTELEQAIGAIEHGLLKATRGSKPPARKMELARRMEYYQVPGFSAAFVHDEELAWAKGFGVVDASSENPVTPETIFQAASISKPFTAMVALHLVEAGSLDLESDANEFFAPGRSRKASTRRWGRMGCITGSPCEDCSRTPPG